MSEKDKVALADIAHPLHIYINTAKLLPDNYKTGGLLIWKGGYCDTPVTERLEAYLEVLESIKDLPKDKDAISDMLLEDGLGLCANIIDPKERISFCNRFIPLIPCDEAGVPKNTNLGISGEKTNFHLIIQDADEKPTPKFPSRMGTRNPARNKYRQDPVGPR